MFVRGLLLILSQGIVADFGGVGWLAVDFSRGFL